MTFNALVDDVLDGYFRLHPVQATEIGMHRHDARWPDLTAAGREERRAWLADVIGRLQAIDASSLTRDEAIDRRILLQNLEGMRFGEEELRESSWSPLSYIYLIGGGLFALLARDFAPLRDRLRNVAARLRGVPDALAAARETLLADGPRPVSRFHTEKAIERTVGIEDLAQTAAREAAALDDAELRGEVEGAAQVAIDAAHAFQAWLRDELLPLATGDFRLGAETYAAKFRHALMTEVTPDQLEERAASAFAQVRGEMIRLSRELWPAWVPDGPMPDDDAAVVRGVLDAVSRDHPRADELLDYCRAENQRIEGFVRERDLIGLADEPMQIVWTPEFLRAFGGAMLIPPGPLDRGQDSFFAITPMPDDWSEERRESYLREDNNRMLRLLTIHEAVPGHYLQLAYSNRCSSLVRTIFQSGVFAEGWAVYITQVMMDAGYGADDPALMLIHWKFYLRSITNAMMDIGIHAGQMDEEEAMRLMVDGGFQEEGEAANKWDRARLSSTQLCEYFLGSVLMHDLEAEGRRRAAAEGRDFAYRPYLESVLAHGTPALPVIRDILYAES